MVQKVSDGKLGTEVWSSKNGILLAVALVLFISIFSVIAFQGADTNNINHFSSLFSNPYTLFSSHDDVIEIISAEHLDSSRSFISDIFSEVNKLDNVWSSVVDGGEYVRVVFEEKLDSAKHIKIYPRVVSGDPAVEVYEKDSRVLIGSAERVVDEEYNTIYLISLPGEQDSFDLKIVGGSLVIDHIVDPVEEISTVVLNSSLGTNLTSENLTAYVSPLNSSQKYIFDWRKDGSSIAVLNMPMDGGTLAENNTKVKDYSDNGFNGTLGNGTSGTEPTYQATGGYDGKGAYQFDGSGDLIDIPDSAALDFTTSFSTVLWFKSNGFSKEWESLITKGDSAYRLARNSFGNNLSFDITGLSPLGLAGSVNVNDGNWHHVAAVYNSVENKKYLYIDGSLDASASVTGTPSTNNYGLAIGNNLEQLSRSFNGTIDEVMVFGRALSSQQVSALYQNRTDLIVSSETRGGEIWSVEATPNDNTADGVSVLSNNVTIKPPTIDAVVLNSTSLTDTTNENLTANAINVSGLGNGKLIYNWKKDSSSIAVFNMPFDGGTLA